MDGTDKFAVDPNDRAPVSAEHRSSKRFGPIGIGAFLVLGLAAAILGGPGLWATLNGQDRFTGLYAALHMDPLPANLQNRREILPLLEKLQKEQCDDKSASSLGDALATLNEKRTAARFLAGFAGQCPRFNLLLYKSADLYYGLSDYAEARKISDQLVEQWPEIAQFHFLAGQIELGLDLPAEAAAEFQNTIELTPDRHSITQLVFLDMAKTFARFGQACKSAAAIQQWVSLDPGQRDNFASQKLVTDYLAQGRCTNYAQGSDSFARTDKNVTVVQVTIGTATGRFIVDTGATLVTLSQDFARAAGLSGDRRVLLKTANGTRVAAMGSAALIRVGRLTASDVPAVILPETGDGLGPRIDGLLGMSFLSRFKVEISPAAISFSPHSR